MLAAAMNPCPCGYWNSTLKECLCTPMQIQRYLSKISGPLLDRVDLHIDVPEVRYRELADNRRGESSVRIAERVRVARALQLQRFRDQSPPLFCNAQMGPRQLERFCGLGKTSELLLGRAMDQLGLSARAYTRILRVSRTITDLAGSESIQPTHISEAIQYRSLDRACDNGF